jgi:polysaccharide export outer membrane protein
MPLIRINTFSPGLLMRRCCALIACLFVALAVSGCMRTGAPVARSSSLDALAYRQKPAVPATRAASYAPGAEPYQLDAGDKLRVVVYGQEGLTNTYAVGAGGAITMPLIGAVQARGLTTAELSASIAARLRRGYLREPYVAVEVETYRPFFILGEVAAPGQYPYVPNMTIESAVAIAGGFTPRAVRSSAELTRPGEATTAHANVPLGTLLRPGDTIVIGERWF